MKSLKSKVEYILEKYPKTRNSDICLTNNIWNEFYPEYIKNGYVHLLSLYELPTQESIKRCRAIIQNKEKRYLPTDPDILRKRQQKEEEIREELGYSKELRQVLELK